MGKEVRLSVVTRGDDGSSARLRPHFSEEAQRNLLFSGRDLREQRLASAVAELNLSRVKSVLIARLRDWVTVYIEARYPERRCLIEGIISSAWAEIERDPTR